MESEYTECIDILEKYRRLVENGKESKNTERKFLEKQNEVNKLLKSCDKKTKKKFNLIFEEFNILKERKYLFGEQKDSKCDEEKDIKNNNDELCKEAKKISAKTTEDLKQSLTVLVQCEDIGNAAVSKLAEDNAKLERINTTNDQIQSDLQISKKLLTRSLKRLYTDKLILCFVFIICALITIIVLSKYNFIELSTS